MSTPEQVAFYNEIYARHPWKWSSIDRDYLAVKILSAELLAEPRRMLDFGCGNGHTLAFFQVQWSHTQYTGVDISDVALDLARQRLPDYGFYNEIPPGKWDVITIMGVAEHFEDPAEKLREISESLALRGRIYLEVPNCLAYSDDKTEGFRQTHAGSGQMEWHWKRETWKQAIKDAGLEIVNGYVGALPEFEFIWVLRVSR